MLMRHDAIQHDMKQLALYGANSVVDTGLGRLNERDGRRGDLLFKGQGAYDRDLVVDISIGAAFAPSYLQSSSHTPNHVLNLLETQKNAKHKDNYRAVGIDFKPLTFEMHGATSETFIKFFKTLVKSAADVNNMHYCVMYNYWQKRISTTMQRFNAKIINMSQKKISRVTGMLRTGDVDLNDVIENERHVHNH
jgi:hypothetical protein